MRRGPPGTVRKLAGVTAARSRRAQNVCSYLRRPALTERTRAPVRPVTDLESDRPSADELLPQPCRRNLRRL